MIEYLYSWSDRGQEGYKQTIEDGKIVVVHSIPIQEAKDNYYKTRSKEMQAYDSGLEAAAGVECKRLAKLDEKNNAI